MSLSVQFIFNVHDLFTKIEKDEDEDDDCKKRRKKLMMMIRHDIVRMPKTPI